MEKKNRYTLCIDYSNGLYQFLGKYNNTANIVKVLAASTLVNRSKDKFSVWKHVADVHFKQCAYCGTEFSHVGNRIKSYCSRKCATTATAIKSTSKRRIRERNDKLGRVRLAILNGFPTTDKRWKRELAAKVGVSVKWISRLDNSGELWGE